MADLLLDSKYDRFFATVADEYGIDPLKDKVLPKLLGINAYKPHTVTQDQRGAPDLIAMKFYGTEKLWWIIMAYNGIASYKDIVEGLELKIPLFSSVISAITENSISAARVQRVISI